MMKIVLVLARSLAALVVFFALAGAAEPPLPLHPAEDDRRGRPPVVVPAPKLPAAADDAPCFPQEIVEAMPLFSFATSVSGIGLIREDHMFTPGVLVVFVGRDRQFAIFMLIADGTPVTTALGVSEKPRTAWRDDGYVTEGGKLRIQPGKPCQWIEIKK